MSLVSTCLLPDSFCLLQMAYAAIESALFRRIVATRVFSTSIFNTVTNTERAATWENTNRLLSVPGFDGLKTGVTSAAGFCLASSCRRSDRHIIIVTLGSSSMETRYADTLKVSSFAWRHLLDSRRHRAAAEARADARLALASALSSGASVSRPPSVAAQSTDCVPRLPPLRPRTALSSASLPLPSTALGVRTAVAREKRVTAGALAPVAVRGDKMGGPRRSVSLPEFPPSVSTVVAGVSDAEAAGQAPGAPSRGLCTASRARPAFECLSPESERAALDVLMRVCA